MTRKQLQLLSIDELRALRHSNLATIGADNSQNNKLRRELLSIQKELYTRNHESNTNL
jgi:hypothetical protein